MQANAVKARAQFFDKLVFNQTHNKRFRNLLLEQVIKNNLSFAIVDQLETKALFSFLSPTTTQISQLTLMRDLKKRYKAREEEIYQKLQDYITTSRRIALTTNSQASNNKLDYIAVTGHIIHKANSKIEFMLLDIIELTNLIYNSLYLC